MTSRFSDDPEISPNTHKLEDDLLTYGPLVLDLRTWILDGETTYADVPPMERQLLLRLMSPRVVPYAELNEVAFAADKQPSDPGRALAVRITRLRALLERVGVSGDAIRAFAGLGYGLGLGGNVARTYTGRRVRMLDRLLASHPNREAVEELEATMR